MHTDPTHQVLSSLTVDDLASRLSIQSTEALLTTLPELIRRGRLGEYLNDEQAQVETGMSRRKLRYLREKRRIPYHKEGRTILYLTSELFELINEGRVPARNPMK